MSRLNILNADALRQRPLPDFACITDKNTKGRVLAVAGSLAVPGPALLCGLAGLRAGAGKVQLALPRSIAANIGASFPECGLIPLRETLDGEPYPDIDERLAAGIKNADAILIGPGLMDADGANRLWQSALSVPNCGPLVLDALALRDAHREAQAIRNHSSEVVLTPHHGEMALMLGVDSAVVASDPLKYAISVARELHCVVVLKSETTYIVGRDGEVWQHSGGCIGLATAGSGDVLAGLLTGFLARGAGAITASLWAVLVHAVSGQVLSERVGTVGFLAREIVDTVPKAIEISSGKR